MCKFINTQFFEVETIDGDPNVYFLKHILEDRNSEIIATYVVPFYHKNMKFGTPYVLFYVLGVSRRFEIPHSMVEDFETVVGYAKYFYESNRDTDLLTSKSTLYHEERILQ